MDSTWERVGARAELEPKLPTRVRVGRRYVALFLWQGEIYAIDDLCPHRGAPMSEGCLGDDGFVECWHHGWEYSLTTGRGRGEQAGSIPRYAVLERDGELFVSSEPLPSA